MKKILSISVALLMLLSGLQLTVSSHYCGGELADAKISLTGHIASCGMEGETDDCDSLAARLNQVAATTRFRFTRSITIMHRRLQVSSHSNNLFCRFSFFLKFRISTQLLHTIIFTPMSVRR